MIKVLGLDLGTTSIGWYLIETDEHGDPMNIIKGGSRIVPLTNDDSDEFAKGQAISKNQKRTAKRTQRKGYDRYQLRRKLLTEKLRSLGMLPDVTLIKLPVLELWQLRAKAATDKIEPAELGRVLYHINQRRGYKHARSDGDDKSQRDYVKTVNGRYDEIKQENCTIGQHFAKKLADSEVITDNGKVYTYRIKEQVFPRAAYIEEFDKIMSCQRKFYPDILNDDTIDELRNSIIFYQRDLKSCKHLVANCEFSEREYKTKDGKTVIAGPKVAPRTSPLSQICKIWESLNNIVLRNRNNETYVFSDDDRKNLFTYLDNNEKLTSKKLLEILKLNKADGWWGGKAIGKGLQGNTTKLLLSKVVKAKYPELLDFKIEISDSRHIDTQTGEVLPEVNPDFIKQPLYKLWHIVYSLKTKEEVASALKSQFGIEDEELTDALLKIDFVKPGYGNKSVRFMRQILPHLMKGMKYSEACDYVGINHSNSLTSEENANRELIDRLPPIQKNELRQPVIEKILNQMINVVNTLIGNYGRIDEIRVELARELKQTKDERKEIYSRNSKRENLNKKIEKLIGECNIRASRSRIQKYKLWEESGHLCFYCGQQVEIKDFLSGKGVETEHIIPRSLFFDDSFSNKVCSCRACNAEKNNMTAYDYMMSKGEEKFEAYKNRVAKYFEEHKISKTKRERLLTPAKEIPQDFIDRQLRQSQYISKKAVEILKQVCRNVWVTSGSVTAFLRHAWDYDNILHDLNLDRYRSGNLTELVSFEHRGQEHTEERIKDWTKRLDHRHHAIDALVIACTKQSYIQRLNTLNTSRDVMFAEAEKQSKEWKEKKSLLEMWASSRPHIPVDEVKKSIDGILISFKAGKKVTSPGKRYVFKKGKRVLAQDNLLVPRGPLCEESVYGRILRLEKNVPLKKLFENPSAIVKPRIRGLVEDRINAYSGDVKKAYASLKNEPIYLDDAQSLKLEYASIYVPEYVIKYPISSIEKKDVDSIVDSRIREIIRDRINTYGEKEAFKDVVYADEKSKIPIRSVRRYTGLSSVVPLRYGEEGDALSFVKPGNNHHVAIYRDGNGKLIEHVVTLWNAVDRKRYGFPVIVEDTDSLWQNIAGGEYPEDFLNSLPAPGLKLEMSMQQNEMFILGMEEEDYERAMKMNDTNILNKYLYRVQKLSSRNYVLRYHLETIVDGKKEFPEGAYYNIRSINALYNLHPHKVRINILGEISEVK